MGLASSVPLRALFPPGTGLDDLHAWVRMSRIARQSQADLDAALSAARLYSADYLTDGETMTGAAWFGPILAAEGEEGALIALEVRYGLAARSIDEASETNAWREIVMRPVPIHRAWGATGLLYGLMLDRLEQGRGFNACERCGRVLQGKRGKRFCARQTISSVSRPAGQRTVGKSDIGRRVHIHPKVGGDGCMVPSLLR